MDWYFIVLIVVGFLLISELIVAFFAFKALFGRKPGEGSFKDLDLSKTLYKNHEKRIKEEFIFLENLISENVYITSHDGLKLRGFYIDNHSDKTVFFVHGYRATPLNNFSWVARKMYDEGYNLFFIDHRAHGESEGKYTTFGIKERFDCVDWVNFVVKEFGSDVKIILTGISMGAATVVMAGSMDIPSNVIGIIADCGYNKPKDIIIKVIQDMKLPPKLIYPFIKLSAKIFGKFDLEEYSPLESVKKIKAPVFFVHGTGDTFIPIKMTEKLYDECISRKVLVPIKDGKHGTSYMKDPDLYIEELEKFFK